MAYKQDEIAILTNTKMKVYLFMNSLRKELKDSSYKLM